jgi:hypothetical protein
MEVALMFVKQALGFASMAATFLIPAGAFAQEVIEQYGPSKGKAFYAER